LAAVRQAYVRGQLEAPIEAIVAHAAAAAARVDGPAAVAKFEKLGHFADDLRRQLLSTVSCPLPTGDPAALRVLRHDLRSAAGKVVNQCDVIGVTARGRLPAGAAEETARVRAAAWRFIEQVNTLFADGPTAAVGDLDVAGLLHTISSTPQFNRIDPARILLADDTADNRDLVCQMLTLVSAHDIVQVPDGAAALAALDAGVFDVVLLDVMMPGLNGIEVLKRIRETARWQHLPVILMSGLTWDDAVVIGIATGADDYLRRPFKPDFLHARVNACIEKKRFRDREVAYQRQIDKLLRALFPPEVVDEVRDAGTVPPRRHDGVGVLFLDVVGFTTWCEAHRDRPEMVAEALQRLVKDMEEAAQKHGVLKIKTIGDAFLGTTGLGRPDPDPVGTLVRCAADMVAAVAGHPHQWQVRVGVNVGTVIAGIIGATQFQFDVFGSTVNVAARLQSEAHAGGVALSEEAWAAQKRPVAGARRVVENVKGVGRMAVWDVDLKTVERTTAD